MIAGEGYRLLREGETIESRDECSFMNKGDNWVPVAESSVGQRWSPRLFWFMRRKLVWQPTGKIRVQREVSRGGETKWVDAIIADGTFVESEE